jgi:hypothetical protein
MSLIRRLLYLKLASQRASSHISMITAIVEKTALAVIILKLFEIHNYWIAIVIGLGILAALILLGHLDLEYGICEAETSLRHDYDPEIRTLRDRSKK